jgi:hypothetical protein
MSDFSFLQDEKCNPYARSLWAEAFLAKPIDWIVNELVASGSFNLFCGSPKSGKTFLLMEMGLSVASGREFLGMKVKRLPVYYCFLEDAPQVIRNRGKYLNVHKKLSSTDQFMFLCDYGMDSVKRGLDFIKQEQGLLVVDPIGELSAQGNWDENKATDVLKLLKDYRELSHAVTGSIVMSHHFRKDGDRMRGSTAFEAGVDGWVNVRKNGTEIIKLDWTLRMGRGGKLGCEMKEENGDIKYIVYTEEELKAKSANGESEDIGHFANKLYSFIQGGPKKKFELARKFKNSKSLGEVQAAIELLVSTNRIIELKNGKGYVYETV